MANSGFSPPIGLEATRKIRRLVTAIMPSVIIANASHIRNGLIGTVSGAGAAEATATDSGGGEGGAWRKASTSICRPAFVERYP